VLEFDDLTPLQKDILCNGCGPKGGIPVPEFVFAESCDRHDFDYWLGHTEFDRLRADWRFRAAMMADAGRCPWWSRWWYRWVADVYYRAVRRWGASAFYYGPSYRTRAELDVEVVRRLG